ncbi:MAG: type II secretion system protein [Patescibacteria group bacterium]|nr:type II secretion system protein [Patescibacteria group bacterium]
MKHPIFFEKQAFTLVEILVYIAIFSIGATFLVGILTVVTKIELRQTSSNEVNQQIAFVANTVQRLVRESSLIENPAGISSSTLVLRMASSTRDPLKIFFDASSSLLYLKEGANNAVALTNNKVKVTEFFVTKYENPGSQALVQIDFTLDYNTDRSQSKFSRTWHSAIGRISAATFDDNIIPSRSDYNIGQITAETWQRLYLGPGSNGFPSYTFGGDSDTGIFNGNGGGINVLSFTTGGTERMNINGSGNINILSSAKIKSLSDIFVVTSTAGFILTSPNGSCFRLGISNGGNITTSSITCP